MLLPLRYLLVLFALHVVRSAAVTLTRPGGPCISTLAVDRPVRVHAISDLHCDLPNLATVAAWHREPGELVSAETVPGDAGPLTYRPDQGVFQVLVVAGDVASDLGRAREAFEELVLHYDAVFVVAGNHDCWIRGPLLPGGAGQELAAGSPGEQDSVAKLDAFMDCARSCGVHTEPVLFETPQAQRNVLIFPLLSWYHASFDQDPDLPLDDQAELQVPDFDRRWGDFRRCIWPESVCPAEEWGSIRSDSLSLSEWFAAQNEPFLDAWATTRRTLDLDAEPVVVSLSHFLPLPELCPEKRFLKVHQLPKVIGSNPLARQVRQLRPHIHVFGHTHIPYDFDIGGVRYVQWCLGTVREQGLQCSGVRAHGPLVIAEGGLDLPHIPTKYGDYYRQHSRDPECTELAPWVKTYREDLRERRRKLDALLRKNDKK